MSVNLLTMLGCRAVVLIGHIIGLARLSVCLSSDLKTKEHRKKIDLNVSQGRIVAGVIIFGLKEKVRIRVRVRVAVYC